MTLLRVSLQAPRFTGPIKASKSDSKAGRSKLDLGDLLGRSKDGFQPLKTDEDEADEAAAHALPSDSDDDDLEEFSVPALRA